MLVQNSARPCAKAFEQLMGRKSQRRDGITSVVSVSTCVVVPWCAMTLTPKTTTADSSGVQNCYVAEYQATRATNPSARELERGSR
jgi:hypothetical protein